MDNATTDFLNKAEAEYLGQINGFIESSLAEQNAGKKGYLDWNKVKADFTQKKIAPSKVHEFYNYDQGFKTQQVQKTQPKAGEAVTPQPQDPSITADVGRQAVAGVLKAGIHQSEFVNEISKWSKDNLFSMKGLPQATIYKAVMATPQLFNQKGEIDKAIKTAEDAMPKAETGWGAAVGGISEFVANFAGFSKWANAPKTFVGRAGRTSLVSGGISATSMVDDSLVLNYVERLDPESRQAFLELVGSEDGKAIPQSTRRVIAGLEGMGLSVLADGFIQVAKSVRGLWKGNGKVPAEEADKILKETAAKDLETPVQPTPMRGEGARGRTAKEMQELFDEREAARKAAMTGQTLDSKLTSALKDKVDSMPAKKVHPYVAMQEANKRLEEAVGKFFEPEVPLEVQAMQAQMKPAFLRTAEDLLTLSEWERINPAPVVEDLVVPANAGAGRAALTDAERTLTTAANPELQALSPEKVAERLQALETSVQPINRAVLKVEANKALSDAERKLLLEEVANAVQGVKNTATKVAQAGNKDLVQQGIITPDGVIDFAKYAEARGASANIGQILAQATVGTTKQQVAGSIAGLLASPALVLADEGEMSEADKKTMADRILVGVLFALGGRFAFKYMFKGSKVAAEAAAKEAEDKAAQQAIVQAETVVSTSLPKAIAPLSSTSAKVLPKIPKEKAAALTDALAKGDVEVADKLKAEIFNLDNIDTIEDVDTLIMNVAEAFSEQTARATRGVVSHEETKAIAEVLGTSEAELTKLYGDTGMLAERMTAARNLLPAIAEKAYAQAKALRELGTADEVTRNAAILELRNTIAKQAAIQMRLKGTQTEIARALSAMRIKARTNDLVIREMSDLVDSLGGQEVNDLFAKQLVEIYETGGESAVNRWIRGSALAKSTDVLKAYWYSSVLSGVSTHMANIVGNLGIVVEGAWERSIANTIGRVTGTKGAEYAKATDYMKGLALGAKLAVGMTSKEFSQLEAGGALKAFKTNAPVLDRFGVAKEGAGDLSAMERPYAISSEALGVHSETTLGKALDVAGKYIFSVPGRALVAEDEIFKSVNYYGELYHMVAQQGRELGLVGKELDNHIVQYIQEPDVGMMEQALLKAREATFTSELDGWQKGLQDVFNKIPAGFLIMPFVRTPMNIVNHFAERLPLIGGLMSKNREMWKAGGAQRDLVLAKQATGMLYTISALTLASSGMITGGSLNDPNKQAQNVAKIQPYSIKVGDTYYSYNRLDPIGMFFGMVADWHEVMASNASEADKQNYATASMTIVANFLQSKTYLRSLADIMRVLGEAQRSEAGGEPAKALTRFGGNMAGSFIPALLSSANKSYVDPTIKEYWEWTDYMKARIPSVSKEVMPAVNIFGQDQEFEGGLGVDMASPVYVKTANPDPAAIEIERLDVDLRPPLKKLGNVDLSAKQYYDYMKMFGTVKLGGKTFQEAIQDRISKPDWADLSETRGDYEGAKEQFIKKTYARYRAEVKAQFLRQNPDVFKKVRDDKDNALLNVRGQELRDIPQQDPYSDNFIEETLQ